MLKGFFGRGRGTGPAGLRDLIAGASPQDVLSRADGQVFKRLDGFLVGVGPSRRIGQVIDIVDPHGRRYAKFIWPQPGFERLNRQERQDPATTPYDEVLIEGLDDWVSIPAIWRFVDQAAEVAAVAAIEPIIDVVAHLLDAGTAEIGTFAVSFEPWDVPDRVAIERLGEMLVTTASTDWMWATPWLQNTPAGDALARELVGAS